MLIERRTAGTKTREDKSAMTRDAGHLHQVEVTFAESFIVAAGVRHTGKLAAIVIGPAMIGAPKGVRVAAIALAYGVAAMHTSVEQQIDLTVVVARDDHRLQSDLTRDEVARLRNLAFVGNVDPFARPEFVEFFAEDVIVAVNASADAIVFD